MQQVAPTFSLAQALYASRSIPNIYRPASTNLDAEPPPVTFCKRQAVIALLLAVKQRRQTRSAPKSKNNKKK